MKKIFLPKTRTHNEVRGSAFADPLVFYFS